jgi:hypothetical protein
VIKRVERGYAMSTKFKYIYLKKPFLILTEGIYIQKTSSEIRQKPKRMSAIAVRIEQNIFCRLTVLHRFDLLDLHEFIIVIKPLY